MLFVTFVMYYGGDIPYFVSSVMHYGGDITYFVSSVMHYGGDIPYFVSSVMHYGGDIPYFVLFRNALRSITEHYRSDDTTFFYLINSNIDQFAQNFASGLIASVNFFPFLFHENRSSTAANIVQIRGALRR